MLHAKFHGNRPPVSEKIFEEFLPYMAWRPSGSQPSCSCDPYGVNKFSFPLPKEALHKIWL